MATITCTMCGENPAIVIMTNLETGAGESPCAFCFPDFILGIAQSIMESGAVEVGEGENAPGDTDTAPESAEAATEAAEPAADPTELASTGGRSPAKSRRAPTDTGDGPVETSGAVAASADL